MDSTPVMKGVIYVSSFREWDIYALWLARRRYELEYLCFVAGRPLSLWYCPGRSAMKSILSASLQGTHPGDD